MLVRRLRHINDYDTSTQAVSIAGTVDGPSEWERVGPAPRGFGPYTDVVRLEIGGRWAYFLADVMGSPRGDGSMSTTEAAQILGVDKRTVRRWAQPGPARCLDVYRTAGGRKRRGSWRITTESVKRLLLRRGGGAGAGPGPLNLGFFTASPAKPARRKPDTAPRQIEGQTALDIDGDGGSANP
jgi:excisionase family DNA binding protein